uniref:Putative LAGLIDADG homing endonuclease n=1 Tax=Gloeotilopsis planctonica TaxID=34157 RepID=A0A1B2RZ21_9CHLO|nr:putative LAGLIDADG homing endonuclease [Gloeotilopsis planctonica]
MHLRRCIFVDASSSKHLCRSCASSLPQTKADFGHFLAGLIDSDGHIRKNGFVVIAFHSKEISVAYYLKKVLNSGSVYKIKNRHAVTYECMSNDVPNRKLSKK